MRVQPGGPLMYSKTLANTGRRAGGDHNPLDHSGLGNLHRELPGNAGGAFNK